MTMLGQVKKQVEDNIEQNKRGIDMVLGATGSPLQLILSAVYQMDAPTGNIPLDEATSWMSHPQVSQAIPLAYGDNVKGFSIVGTTPLYAPHFGATLQKGHWNRRPFDVVIGHKVAISTGLDVDSTFYGVHGLMEDGEIHDHHAYKVTGVLRPTGKVIDRLVLCDLESVWNMHDHNHDHDHDHDHAHDEECHHDAHDHDHECHHDAHDHDHECHHDDHNHAHAHDHHKQKGEHDPNEPEHNSRDITAVLLKMKSPMAKITFPGLVKKQSPGMQVALPEIEMNRLFSLLGIGIKALEYLAILILMISAFSVWLSLYSTLKERRYELAMIRVMGGSRQQLFAQLMIESLALCVASYFVGLVMGSLGFGIIGILTASEMHMSIQWFSIHLQQQWILFLTVIGLGFCAAIIPAIQAYSMSISETLSHE
jgi:putative ABC transport system permease protein